MRKVTPGIVRAARVAGVGDSGASLEASGQMWQQSPVTQGGGGSHVTCVVIGRGLIAVAAGGYCAPVGE